MLYGIVVSIDIVVSLFSVKSLLTETMMSVDDKTPNGLSLRHKSNFVEHETLQPKMCCSEARPKKWWLDL